MKVVQKTMTIMMMTMRTINNNDVNDERYKWRRKKGKIPNIWSSKREVYC